MKNDDYASLIGLVLKRINQLNVKVDRLLEFEELKYNYNNDTLETILNEE